VLGNLFFSFPLHRKKTFFPFLDQKKRELCFKTRAPAHPPSRMIFCDKNYFFGGGASATSSRDSAPSLLRRKKKEVFSPSRTMKGGKK
jgi:hypothetical protein